jgi:hypothetical protein
VNGDPEREERLPESCRFAEGWRQDHQTSAIERKNERLLERSDGLEDRPSPRDVGFNDRLASDERHTSPLQFLEKCLAGRVAQEHMPTARWELEHGPVLADDGIEAREVPSNTAEIGQPPPRDQNDGNSAPSCVGDRFTNGGIEYPLHRNRAVVVECKGGEFHDNPTRMVSLCRAAYAGFPAAMRFRPVDRVAGRWLDACSSGSANALLGEYAPDGYGSKKEGHDGSEVEARRSTTPVRVPIGERWLPGDLGMPAEAHGIILFAHGSGSFVPAGKPSAAIGELFSCATNRSVGPARALLTTPPGGKHEYHETGSIS